jgi:hypothetical protein
LDFDTGVKTSAGSEELASHRVRSGWLLVARATWVLVVCLTLILFVAGLKARYNELLRICSAAACPTAQLAPEEAEVLSQWGLSVGTYALFFITLDGIFTLGYALTGLGIFLRKPDDLLPISVSLTLVVFGAIIPPPLRALQATGAVWRLPVSVIQILGWGSFFTFFYLFPDGKFVPRWTRTRPLLFVGWALATFLFPGTNIFSWSLPLALLVLLAWFSSGVVAQIYRYVRVSNPIQRQQTKWVVFGFAAAALGIMLFAWPSWVVPALRQPGEARLLYQLIGIPFFAFALMLIPASIGVSILRYRLWDIDVLINRTLVYGLLTGILVVIYLSSVVVLQAVLGTLTGQRQSELVTVMSTLAIAALFVPLRQQVQNIIDRRFYRRKYDAALALAAFAATARDEVDLAQLTETLVAVVQETVQPTRLALWLISALPERTQAMANGRSVDSTADQPPVIFDTANIKSQEET